MDECICMSKSFIPTEQERREVHQIRDSVLSFVKDELQERGFDARVEAVGSTAKDTFVRGDMDIDIFVVTPNFKEAYRYLSTVFHEGAPKTGAMDIWHFQHGSYDVDLVFVPPDHPRIDTLTHTEFMNKHLTPEMKQEIIAAKVFLKRVGVYGPEIGGVPGIAIEEAVRQHGTFEKMCQVFSKAEEPPFLADPAKPSRTLLAAVTPIRWEQLRRYCNNYAHYLRRQRAPNLLRYSPEEYLEAHQSWTHLRFQRHADRATDFLTALSACNRSLHEVHGQHPEVHGTCDAYVFEDVVISFDVAPKKLGATKIHCGPPLNMNREVAVFKKKYPNVFERGGKVCTILDRGEVEVEALMRQKITYRMEKIAESHHLYRGELGI